MKGNETDMLMWWA